MPLSPLPSILREDFNDHLQQETWPEVYGAERGTLSGEPLKSGTALIFKGVGLLNSILLSLDTAGHFLVGRREKKEDDVFSVQDGMRMLVSRDLDCTNTLYIQFSFKFITKGPSKLGYQVYDKRFDLQDEVFQLFALLLFPPGVPERSHSVLLQYSVNGGISWLMLDEFYFPASTDTLFLHLPLPASAQTNATRFRLWQPYNGGKWTVTSKY